MNIIWKNPDTKLFTFTFTSFSVYAKIKFAFIVTFWLSVSRLKLADLYGILIFNSDFPCYRAICEMTSRG